MVIVGDIHPNMNLLLIILYHHSKPSTQLYYSRLSIYLSLSSYLSCMHPSPNCLVKVLYSNNTSIFPHIYTYTPIPIPWPYPPLSPSSLEMTFQLSVHKWSPVISTLSPTGKYLTLINHCSHVLYCRLQVVCYTLINREREGERERERERDLWHVL